MRKKTPGSRCEHKFFSKQCELCSRREKKRGNTKVAQYTGSIEKSYRTISREYRKWTYRISIVKIRLF